MIIRSRRLYLAGWRVNQVISGYRPSDLHVGSRGLHFLRTVRHGTFCYSRKQGDRDSDCVNASGKTDLDVVSKHSFLPSHPYSYRRGSGQKKQRVSSHWGSEMMSLIPASGMVWPDLKRGRSFGRYLIFGGSLRRYASTRFHARIPGLDSRGTRCSQSNAPS
jgi:hypothetical protein